MNEEIIILSFDMESDVGSWTAADRGVKKGTPEILRVLKNHHVKATFLFTGREAQNNPRIVEKVLAAGHEVGCHTMYHETVGTAVFDMPGANFVLESEIKGRLELATNVIRKVAGVRPVSFRAPRLFGSTAMVNALEELGYRVDSSFPSYFYARNFLPYHPSSRDWSRKGKMNILEIPVFYDMDAADDEKHRARDQWPILRLKGVQHFTGLCRRMMNSVKDKDGNCVLCVYLHPWEFVPMPKTIQTDEVEISFKPFLHENCGQVALKALDEFIGRMKREGIGFTTLRECAAKTKSL
jgi:peptidoglycan-N-acetylglucosamine deacetylase